MQLEKIIIGRIDMKLKTHIVRDYFQMFRPANLKKNNLATKLSFLPTYFICLLFCVVFLGKDKISWQNALVQFAIFTPLAFIYFSVLAHPVQLSKMMYLCPLSSKERRSYIYGAYYFRIGIHMLSGILAVCIAAIFSYCDIFSAIEILLNYLMISLLVSQESNKTGTGSSMVIGEIIFAAALLSNLLQLGIVWDDQPDMWIKALLFVLFCFVQVPLEIKHLKFVNKQLQTAVFFETDIN